MNATQITKPAVQPETTPSSPPEEPTTRILESNQTQITIESTSLSKQPVQPAPTGESAPASSPLTEQPSTAGQLQDESSQPVAANVNTSPKSSQLQVRQFIFIYLFFKHISDMFVFFNCCEMFFESVK